MPAKKRIAGVVGALGLAGCSAAFMAAATSARADDCSGLMCMFQSRSEAPPPAPAPQPAPPAAPVATADAAEAPAPAKPKARARPVAVVTIAAGPTEVAKLKTLAGVMQKPRVKIVEAKDDAAAADFAVTTALDQDHGGVEKAKLFTEEMHILAGAKIQSVADLSGKVVSFGADHSAGQAAARKAFEALGVKVAETPLDLDNALDGLATGDIDAVVLLAPQPDPRLKKIKSPGLHLVAWPQSSPPPDGAVAATIDAGSYPGLAKPGDKVAALGVDAVLTLSPKGERQPAAKAFLGALSQHSAALSRKGFDLIKADLEARSGRRVANAEAR